MSKFEDFTDTDLMIWLRIAQEMQDGKYIKAIKKEITRRNRDE